MKIAVIIFNVILFWVLVATAPTEEFASGNNLFAAAVYKDVVKNGEKNVLVSPLSAEIVLALTQSGAKDETAEEIRNSLHLPNSEDKIRDLIKNLLTNLRSDERVALHTANKVYVNENFPIKNEFKEVATKIYGAGLENMDFSKKEEAAATINKWVEEHTNNKIHNLVDSGNLGEVVLLLVNALYFQGSWTDNFFKVNTKKRDFYKTATDIIQVDTMYDRNRVCGYFESDELEAKFLELHIKGDETSLVLVLPNEKDGLGKLESQMEKVFTPHTFTFGAVEVTLPKFKIESATNFKKVLKNLGMSKAFSFNDADFSGIAGKKGDLAISEVLQKAFIGVDEEGVEAAAATTIFLVPNAGLPPPTNKFNADHPFIFYLKVKDVILFAGRVSDPKS